VSSEVEITVMPSATSSPPPTAKSSETLRSPSFFVESARQIGLLPGNQLQDPHGSPSSILMTHHYSPNVGSLIHQTSGVKLTRYSTVPRIPSDHPSLALSNHTLMLTHETDWFKRVLFLT